MKNKKTNTIVYFVLLPTAIAALWVGLLSPVSAVTKAKAPVKAKTTAKPVVLVPRRLDGVLVNPKVANLRPIAVMIDNHTAARPQSGLQSASIVYESLAEGGIPRFMAIFANYDTKLIGPIRSARPYFVKYANEYMPGIIHAGSPDAQNLIKQLKMINIEGVKGPTAKLFFRKFGTGVHNLYTTGKNLATIMTQKKNAKITANYRAWKYVNEAGYAKRPTGKHGATIDLGYGKSYAVAYAYDRKKNEYVRYTGGKKQVDRATGKPIAVKNVVILNVPKEKVLDKKGRLDLQITGKGKAVLLQNGKAMTITWTKRDTKARTIFTMSNGSEVKFVRGNTWITVVPRGHSYKVF